EKRGAKSLVDVGCDRTGEALGGALIRVAMLIVPAASQYPVVLALAVLLSLAALAASSRLTRGYIQTLEKSLGNHAVHIDLSSAEDALTRTSVLERLPRPRPATAAARSGETDEPPRRIGASPSPLDPELQDAQALRSGDRDAVVAILRRQDGITAALVPHAVPLLANDAVAADATFALRKVAEEQIGLLPDALIDPNQPFAVRRRLPRVFSVCVSQRAADGLLLGLEDPRFEVRYQSGRSLASILQRNPMVRIDAECIFAFVL